MINKEAIYGALPVLKSLKGNYFFGEICCDTSADTTRIIENEQGDGNKVVDWVEVSWIPGYNLEECKQMRKDYEGKTKKI